MSKTKPANISKATGAASGRASVKAVSQVATEEQIRAVNRVLTKALESVERSGWKPYRNDA